MSNLIGNKDDLPPELQALAAIAPDTVWFEQRFPGHWKVEARIKGGTSTRYMSTFDHDLEEWAFAVKQVTGSITLAGELDVVELEKVSR